ncbi:putative ataxin-3 homolog [Phragmites australis]|uniref:putative ataxin-3 homolog n=1 Tax=Phragmites australis TaxID=29695 RepID=UPI002D772259|nr:putative ataxin-3 homolog [Phragmites australis]
MEAASNGGLLYHEVQEGKLCAVHCVNTALQGPFFSEFDLAALAADLDQRERQVMLEGGAATAAAGDFLAEGEGSHNVSLGGDFSIQVLQKALEVWDLQVIPLDSPAAGSSLFDPELEAAFICHLQDHWFCIRKVNGEWYNFNSLYPAPEHLSKFYLSAFIDTLKGSGWSIFAVRGNFPKECPMATEGSNGFGQWLTPDDARKITASCNQVETPIQQANTSRLGDQSEGISEMDMIAAQQEEADLNAAIAASLMETGGLFASYDAHQEDSKSQDAPVEVASGTMSEDSDQEEADKLEPSEPPSENTQESASGSNTRGVASLKRKEPAEED